MSGTRVPYHLRLNKAVDRQLFLELLSRLQRHVDIVKYDYIGFGALFFEDFRAIHSTFGTRRMISLEPDATSYRRQLFSRPLSCIICRNQDSSSYIRTFSSSRSTIHWLDYTDPNKLRDQLQDIETLLPKLDTGDILRVTFNANPEALGSTKTQKENGEWCSTDEVRKARLEKLQERIGEYLYAGTSFNQMSAAELPKVIALACKSAVTNALMSTTELIFLHLSAFVYSDSPHQMMTITGILLAPDEEREFFKKTLLKNWKYTTLTWGDFKRINLPVLSLKERLYIDQNLPKWLSPRSSRKSKIQLDSDPRSHKEFLDSYADYYRHFPNFQRVMM